MRGMPSHLSDERAQATVLRQVHLYEQVAPLLPCAVLPDHVGVRGQRGHRLDLMQAPATRTLDKGQPRAGCLWHAFSR